MRPPTCTGTRLRSPAADRRARRCELAAAAVDDRDVAQAFSGVILEQRIERRGIGRPTVIRQVRPYRLLDRERLTVPSGGERVVRRRAGDPQRRDQRRRDQRERDGQWRHAA